MGVWIEIYIPHPSHGLYSVTPYVGVWIEIFYIPPYPPFCGVTPYVGVWIEIQTPKVMN